MSDCLQPRSLTRSSRAQVATKSITGPHCREIDEIGMRQEPETGHVDQFLRGDPD
jgi:hypothetical protein